MKNVPENELFSAYLDGELTAGEQAKVERLLAASPAARQLMDELRALSATLQAMPTYKLEQDLAPRVLRAAERRMLGQKKAEPGPLVGTPPHEEPQPTDVEAIPSPWQGMGRRLLSPRNLVWPLLAVSVALMVMALDSGHERTSHAPREVAQRPDDRPARRTPSNATMQAPEKETAKQPASEAAEEDTAKKLKTVSSTASAKGKPAGPASGAGEPSAAAPVLSRSAPAAEVPGHGAPVPKSFAAKGAGFGGSALAPRPSKRGPHAGLTHDKTGGAGGGRSFAGAGAGLTPLGEGQVARKGPGPAGQNAMGYLRHAEPWHLAPGTTLVVCDVSPQAARSRAFDRLLSRQQIVLESRSRQVANKQAADMAEMLVDRKPGEGKSGENKPGEKGAQGHRGNGRASQPPEADRFKDKTAEIADDETAGELDLVLVQATPAQVEAMLDALKARPQDFVTVCVRPAPSRADQQGWTRYSRGPLEELVRQQPNGVINRATGGGQGGSAALADRYRSADEKREEKANEKRKAGEQQRRARATLGRAQHVELPLDGVQLRSDGAMPAEPVLAGPDTRPANAPPRPQKPAAMPPADPKMPIAAPQKLAVAPPAPEPAAPRDRPKQKAPAGTRVNQPAAAPAESPTAQIVQPPAKLAPPESVRETPGAAGDHAFQAAAPAPPSPPWTNVEKKAGAANRHEQDKKGHGKGQPAAEPENVKDADQPAVPCQVLFVLRVVKPGDVAAAAAAQTKAASVMATETAAPPAAKADAARQAAPSGKR